MSPNSQARSKRFLSGVLRWKIMSVAYLGIYVKNNPANLIDPWGLSWWDSFKDFLNWLIGRSKTGKKLKKAKDLIEEAAKDAEAIEKAKGGDLKDAIGRISIQQDLKNSNLVMHHLLHGLCSVLFLFLRLLTGNTATAVWRCGTKHENLETRS